MTRAAIGGALARSVVGACVFVFGCNGLLGNNEHAIEPDKGAGGRNGGYAGGTAVLTTGSGGQGGLPDSGGGGGRGVGNGSASGAATGTGTGGIAGEAGRGGIAAVGGAPGGVAGRPGTGGSIGTGGYTGAGTTIVADPTGYVSGTTNAFGINGPWYSYSDGMGPGGATTTGDCEVAKHDPMQCSTVTSPAVGTPFKNAGGKMCTSGKAARVADIVGMTGMPDYMTIWGAAIALDLNNSGVKGTFNATANISGKIVTGFSFDIDIVPVNGIRVEFPTPTTDGKVGGADYWSADMFYPPSPIKSGTNKVYLADIRGARGTSFDQTKIESIAFHVPSNPTSDTPYTFCISNVNVLTDNGGGCPPPSAGGTCNIPACGCATGQVCYPDTPTTGLTCVANGGLAEGVGCASANCALGLGCFGGICTKYCHWDGDCTPVDSASACVQTTWSSTAMPIPGVSVCSRVCDPVSPQGPHFGLLACPTGFGCSEWGEAPPAATDCVKQAGVGLAGATCAVSADCAPGNYCSMEGRCRHFCYTSADCATGSTCGAFATPIYAGTHLLGGCSL